jgi:DnaJ-class molecular chaperone
MKTKITLIESGQILGCFASLHEADAWHDNWLSELESQGIDTELDHYRVRFDTEKLCSPCYGEGVLDNSICSGCQGAGVIPV